MLYVGGLVGYSQYIIFSYQSSEGIHIVVNNFTISNCYASGNIHIDNAYYSPNNMYNYVGGLVGRIASYSSVLGAFSIRNCVAANDTIISICQCNPHNYINRIVGYMQGILQNNYANGAMVVDSNGNVPIISGLNTEDGFSIPMDSLKSFSFYNTFNNWYQMPWSIQNPLGTWKICDGQDLPFLRYQRIICGDTITATAGTNGTISPNGMVIVEVGNDQTFTFTPNTCYEIDSLWVDSVYLPDSIAVGSYTFNNVTKNHTIEVTFKRLPPDTVIICDTVCYGTNYTQNNFNIANATTDSVCFNNDFNTSGCDSLTRLKLMINPLIITQISDSICEGYFYDFHDNSLTASGIYFDTLQAVSDCDSIIELTLTVISTDTTQISVDICEGDNYDFFGRQLTEEGIYYETLQSIHGSVSVSGIIGDKKNIH